MKFRPYDQAQTKFVNLNYRETLGEDDRQMFKEDLEKTREWKRYLNKFRRADS